MTAAPPIDPGLLAALLQPPSPTKPPTARWVGASSTTYDLQVHPIGTTYYRYPGVYIFCRRERDGWLSALYVGATGNFDKRLREDLLLHHRWQSIRAAGATHICTIHIPGDEADCLRAETDLRNGLNPPCNRQ